MAAGSQNRSWNCGASLGQGQNITLPGLYDQSKWRLTQTQGEETRLLIF
jgi:hypothetical protein